MLSTRALLLLSLTLTVSGCRDARCNIQNCQAIKRCGPNQSTILTAGEPELSACGIDFQEVQADVLDSCLQACEATGSGANLACLAQACAENGDVVARCVQPSTGGPVRDPLCVEACDATSTTCEQACGRQHAGVRASCLRCASLCSLDRTSCFRSCPRR